MASHLLPPEEFHLAASFSAPLLLSFTWVPSKSDWSHPGVVLRTQSARCAAGDTASSTGLNGVLAPVTVRNSLVFI